MTEAAMVAVMALASAKVIPETRTRPPFEWVGELVAMVLIVIIGLAVGFAVHIAANGPTFDPPAIPPFVASFAGPSIETVTA